MKWYNKHIGDYHTATKDLTMLEHGAYNLLLDHYYATEEPIPLKPAVLQRIFGVEKDRQEYAALTRILRRFFAKSPRGWIHKKADEEISKSRRISARRAQAGALGAMTTNRKAAIAASANAEANSAPQHPANAEQLPESKAANGSAALTTTTAIEEQKQPHSPAAPDGIPENAEHSGNQKRAQAKVIALAALDYLNAKAGKKFRQGEATLKFGIDRVLYDNATLADLCAVVDHNLRRVQDGKLDGMYLRPETLWNKTKFSSYIGEIGSVPPAQVAAEAAASAPTPRLVRILRLAGESEKVVTEYYVPGQITTETFSYDSAAKKAYGQFRAFIEQAGNTTLIVQFERERRTFKTNELQA